VYSARSSWSSFGTVIIASLAITFTLLPVTVIVILIRLFLRVEKYDIGAYGAYLRWFGKLVPLKPLTQDIPVIESPLKNTIAVTPSEQSREYLGYEKMYRRLMELGFSLEEQVEDEPLSIEPPNLRVVGGETEEQLGTELSTALRLYEKGNTGRKSLADAMHTSQHRASHLITQLKAKGLV